MSQTTKRITYSALMMALVFVFTFAIKIPTFNGYIHLGDAMVLLSGIVLGPIYGALAAGIGSMFSDLLGGYTQWALPTLCIKGLMAFIVGLFAIKKQNRRFVLFSGIGFSFLWILYNAFLYFGLLPQVDSESEELIQGMELTDLNHLMQLTSNVKTILLLCSILIPFIVLIILLFLKRSKNAVFSPAYSVSFVIAGSSMISLYYLSEYVLYGNYLIPIFGFPFNLMQFTAGLILAHLLLPVFYQFKLIPKNN